MVKLKKYNLVGKEVGSVDFDEAIFEGEVNPQMVKDYLIALRNNKRQWSASTKTRKDVAHTTKKCYRQKGTGNARHSDLVAPQFRGGGVAHGPKPKFDQHVRINKKERRSALRALIFGLIQNEKLHLIETTALDEPKTQTIARFLRSLGLERNRVLFLGEAEVQTVEVDGEKKVVDVKCNKHHNLSKSIRNIPRIEFKLAKNISGYDVALTHDIFLTEEALQELVNWLKVA